MLSDEERRALVKFTRRVLIVVLIVSLALMLRRVAPLVILGFGGVLLAVILHRLAGLLAAGTGLGRHWALGVVALTLLAVIVGMAWLFGQQAFGQVRTLGMTARQGVGQVQQLFEQFGIRDLIADGGAAGMLGSLVTPVWTLLDVLAGILVVLFLGVYLAASPEPYRRGVLRLVPRQRQERAGEVLDAVGQALWRWMIGQAVSMLTIAVLVTVTLLLIGIPLAVPLGIIAGLFEFIPIVGPWAAGVPAVLIALTQSGEAALWVAMAYFLIQQVESYVIHPIAERWAVSLPPALTVASTVGFGLLFGVLGVLFATPIAVALMVVVRMLYVRDTLGEQPGDSRMPG